MNGFAIFMLIFGMALLLTGFYMYKGHKIGMLEGRVAFKNISKKDWINIGKWTMIVSIIPFLLALLGYVLKF